ncbi:MAG: hypothetical protein KC413_18070 [Anaerolineales bacterium]|nr:hypothetical protein [Anaerolineales bacterium]
MKKKLKIKKGDRVKINAMGITVEGVVDSANNYDQWGTKPDCWYIELTSDSGKSHYWKQDRDGGSVELLLPEW